MSHFLSLPVFHSLSFFDFALYLLQDPGQWGLIISLFIMFLFFALLFSSVIFEPSLNLLKPLPVTLFFAIVVPLVFSLFIVFEARPNHSDLQSGDKTIFDFSHVGALEDDLIKEFHNHLSDVKREEVALKEVSVFSESSGSEGHYVNEEADNIHNVHILFADPGGDEVRSLTTNARLFEDPNAEEDYMTFKKVKDYPYVDDGFYNINIYLQD